MKKALFPGTFDPPTLGHLDIIERAARLCGDLYIGVPHNGVKKPIFSCEEKIELLRIITADFSNVHIVAFSGLAVDLAKSLDVSLIVRGLRNTTDFEYEYQMASSNHAMTGIETVFLCADPKYVHLSGTLIREIANHGRRLHGFVPEPIEDKIFQKLCKTM